MRPRVFRLWVSLISASLLLLLLSSLLFSTTPARSRSASVSGPARTGIVTDTRWIELIRSGVPGPQLKRSAVALPTLNLHLTDYLIAGQAASPASIMISVQRGTAVIVNAVTTPYPDGAGYFYVVNLNLSSWTQGGGYYYPLLMPGDVISLTQATASLTMTVPTITALVDAPADEVYGVAPISRAVTAYLYPFSAPDVLYTQTVQADAAGNYHASFTPTLDVHPRDSGYVAYSEAANRTTYLRFVTPFLRAQSDGSEISGVAAPYSMVVITVTDAAGVPNSYQNFSTGPDGSFGSAYGYWGINLKPGNRIVATSAGQTFSMTVLTMTAQTDLTNHRVAGFAPVDQPIEVLRFVGPLCCASNSFWNEAATESAIVTATVTGQYTATLALAVPNYGAAIVTSPDGNQTYARFAVPYLSARMGTPYQLLGQIDDVSTPATITLQGPSGYNKDVRSIVVASDAYFLDYGYGGLTLDTGDVITVTAAHGGQATMKLPNLTGQIDPVTDIISGTAPPGARLTLTVYFYGFPVMLPTPPPAPTSTPYIIAGGGGPPSTPYTAIVTATAQGNYLVDLHGILDLTNYSTGEVSLTTAEGYGVSRVLSLSRQEGCDFHPQLVYVGGNQVDFSSSAKWCSQYTYGSVRLRDAAGHLKSQQALPVGPVNYYFSISFYTGTLPVAITPGDVVEVEWTNSPQFVPTPIPTSTPWLEPTRMPSPTPTRTPYAFRSAADDQLITIVVPTLTVQLNQAANTITGLAPANTTVALNLYPDKLTLRAFTATVDAQGAYTIDLAGNVTLQAGDVAGVIYTPIDPPAFSAMAVLPLLRTQLYQSNVDGYLSPLSTYTATVQTTPPVMVAYQGNALSNGYFSFQSAVIKPGDTVVVTTAQRVLRLTVPYLTAHVDRASATVVGQAPPFAPLRVEPYGYYGISQNVTATATGAYSVSFPSLAPLSTTYGKLTYFDAAGNQAVLSFATAHWDVVVNTQCLNGIVDVAGAPVTLTLRANTGSVKSTLILTPTYPYYSGCFTATVQSGDQLFLRTASTTEVFTVPLLTARHNYALQAVEGVAPPNHGLYAEVWWGSNNYRHTYSDANGRYGIDTSDLHPSLQTVGRVILGDEAGNTTAIYFTVTGYQAFLPIVRR